MKTRCSQTPTTTRDAMRAGDGGAERKLETMKDTSGAQQLTADKIVDWAISVYLRGDE